VQRIYGFDVYNRSKFHQHLYSCLYLLPKQIFRYFSEWVSALVKENIEHPWFPSTSLLVAASKEENGIRSTLGKLKLHLNESRIIIVDNHGCNDTVQAASDLSAAVFYQEGKVNGKELAIATKHTNCEFDYADLTDVDLRQNKKGGTTT
jgi:hypothetical protein